MTLWLPDARQQPEWLRTVAVLLEQAAAAVAAAPAAGQWVRDTGGLDRVTFEWGAPPLGCALGVPFADVVAHTAYEHDGFKGAGAALLVQAVEQIVRPPLRMPSSVNLTTYGPGTVPMLDLRWYRGGHTLSLFTVADRLQDLHAQRAAARAASEGAPGAG